GQLGHHVDARREGATGQGADRPGDLLGSRRRCGRQLRRCRGCGSRRRREHGEGNERHPEKSENRQRQAHERATAEPKLHVYFLPRPEVASSPTPSFGRARRARYRMESADAPTSLTQRGRLTTPGVERLPERLPCQAIYEGISTLGVGERSCSLDDVIANTGASSNGG